MPSAGFGAVPARNTCVCTRTFAGSMSVELPVASWPSPELKVIALPATVLPPGQWPLSLLNGLEVDGRLSPSPDRDRRRRAARRRRCRRASGRCRPGKRSQKSARASESSSGVPPTQPAMSAPGLHAREIGARAAPPCPALGIMIGSAVRCTVIRLQPLDTACIEFEPMATSVPAASYACTVSATLYSAVGVAGSGCRSNVEPPAQRLADGPRSMSSTLRPARRRSTDQVQPDDRRSTGDVLVGRDRHLDVRRTCAQSALSPQPTAASDASATSGSTNASKRRIHRRSAPPHLGRAAPLPTAVRTRPVGAHLASPSGMTHLWLWAGLFAVVLGAIALDLGVHRHQRRPLTLRAAALLVAPVDLAVARLRRARLVAARRHLPASRSTPPGCLEKSLSFDNLMVFLLVFRALQGTRGAAPSRAHLGHPRRARSARPHDRRRRASCSPGGTRSSTASAPSSRTAACARWWRGRRTATSCRTSAGCARSAASCRSRRASQAAASSSRPKTAAARGTMLLFTLIVIELADVMFAVDSIPAVLGVTSDLQIVFSSNVLAVLGLRALYSVVEKLVAELRYLRFGIGAILDPGRRQDVLWTASCTCRRWSALAITVGILGRRRWRRSLGQATAPATAPTPPSPARRGAPDARASWSAPRAAAAGRS